MIDRIRRFHVPSFRDLDQLVIGMIGIIAVAAVVTGVFAYGTVGGRGGSYQLSAVFTDTGGIESGADVRVAGVSVGTVTGVEADFDTGQVILTFDVDDGVALGPETRAEIAAATLLGGYYLRLYGEVTEPHLESLPDDDPRRRIGLEHTRNPLSLVGTLSDTTDLLEGIHIEDINAVMAELADATHRNIDLVPELLADLTRIGDAVTAREQQIRDLIGNGETITAALASRDEQLVALIDSATALLDTITARRDELATTLGAGSSAVAQLTALITTHRASIDALLSDAHVFLDRVGTNIETINDGLGDAGALIALLAATRNPSGGFDTTVEGVIVNNDQATALFEELDELLSSLGL
jgi:phospholipid/cholesterol/gamma-HCH transport system substrate-binding protein